jgi:2-(1,2-epoxy-1,2-dihydrophenyl)acetyl-CoA isomerase
VVNPVDNANAPALRGGPSFGDVTVSVNESFVATLEIQRPPDNFFDRKLIADIADALDAIDGDDACRVTVLCSAGKNFCAGADLRGRALEVENGRHLYDEAVRVFSGKKPIVAAVQGAAIGGGLGLALAADFRVAAPEARFSANFARLGFHHGFGLSVTLPQVVGAQHALELLYTGKRINGEEALAIRLCDRLSPLKHLRDEAIEFAAEIAASGPLAIESIRQTQRGDLPERIRAATTRERAEQERLQKTHDFREGVRAMGERRAPKFERR